jgi:hypothetical protein
MQAKLKAVSPVGDPGIKTTHFVPPLETLNGKKVCEVWNGSFQGEASFRIIEEMLRKRYPRVKVIPYSEFPLFPVTALTAERKTDNLEALRGTLLQKGCDAVISGNGS